MVTDTQIVDWLEDRIISARCDKAAKVVELHVNDQGEMFSITLTKGLWGLRDAVSQLIEMESRKGRN